VTELEKAAKQHAYGYDSTAAPYVKECFLAGAHYEQKRVEKLHKAVRTYFASGFPRGPEEMKLEQALAEYEAAK
jgi:hypothetical protein